MEDLNQNKIEGSIKVVAGPVGPISNGIVQICSLDYDLDFFENQYPLTEGMTYDSYVIFDDKTVVMDTADARVMPQWFDKLAEVLGDRRPDYLVVHHLEPDHTGGMLEFGHRYPDCRIVCSAKAKGMMAAFGLAELVSRVDTVIDGDTLNIGKRILRFMSAPMVHWPEVMVTYDESTQTLFTADAFGTFGTAMAEELIDEQANRDGCYDRWVDEARRYYINICGKYGSSVQTLLRKLAPLKIKYICPLHGPAVIRDIDRASEAYWAWSSYKPEVEGVFIAVATLHGFTLEVAAELAEALGSAGVRSEVVDLRQADLSACVAKAFMYPTVVFASATYDGGIVPAMADYLKRLAAKGWQNRRGAIIENGSWAPAAARILRKALAEDFKNIELVEPVVSVRTRINELNRVEIAKLAQNLAMN